MAKITEMVTGSLFLTQERALKKILHDRERGELAKARRHALEALEKWPGDYDLAIEAIQASLDLSDYPQAANLLKNAYKRHANRRDEIMELARSSFSHSSSTLIGSFIIEMLLKSRNLEAAADLVGAAPDSFSSELAKRGETRAKNLSADGQERSSLYAENALLLGVLYHNARQFEKAGVMLGTALEILPDDAQPIGGLLAQIESEIPDSAAVKYYLGLASLLLAHPDRAQARYFQCMERTGPPLDRVLATIDASSEPMPDHSLLKGEALIRAGRTEEGAAAVRDYLDREPAHTAGDEAAPRTERCRRAASRLTILPADTFTIPAVTFLYAEAVAALGHMKDAAGALEETLERDPGRAPTIIEWLERAESTCATAPGQHLLARLYAKEARVDDAVRAGRLAADMDQTGIPRLLEALREITSPPREREPKLVMLLAELHARLGDRESAEEALGLLKRTRGLPDEELMRLSADIMRHCGVTLTGVLAAVDISARRGAIAESVPCVMAFYREKRDEHGAFADALRELAEEDEGRWNAIAELADRMAAEEELSQPLRLVQALAHLFAGEVERAVFEFDQLAMLDGALHHTLVDAYRKALGRYDDNATLHLALYHLYLEDEAFADAAHHLCRTLELDPNQIRDVIQRFDALVERDPGNPRLWEEMLKTALATNRTSLAREILKRAVAALPTEQAAALHEYGARISIADGEWGDALRCLSTALGAEQADARAIEADLRSIIERAPHEARAHFLLAEALLRLGREPDAVGAYRACLELSPDCRGAVRNQLERLLPTSIEPWILSGLLGEIVWLEGDHEEALRLFAAAQRGPRESLGLLNASLDRIRESDPRDSRFGVLRARTLALEGRCSEAVSSLDELLERDAGLVQTVRDILQGIVAERPAQCDANALLARLYLNEGDAERSREALMRIMADESADAARVEAIAETFLEYFEMDGRFLVRYADLKARTGAHEEALARLRGAFDRESALAAEAIAVLERHEWPEALSRPKSLLAVDCMTAAGRGADAFEIITGFESPDRALVGELVQRIRALIERSPRREHFSFGAALLAAAGNIGEAERLLEDGKRALGGADALDLTIERAEILHGSGDRDRAARIFDEALAAAADRAPIYARIERSYLAWGDRAIDNLLPAAGTAQAAPGSVELLADLLLERGRADEALAAVSKSAAAPALRRLLLGRIYLAMERPFLACAALCGAAADDSIPADLRRSILYLEGVARERALDHGRAAASFAAVAGDAAGHADSRARALRNYAAFIAETCGETAYALEKAESI